MKTRYYKRKDVAKIFGVNVDTITRWAKEDRFKHVIKGGGNNSSWRFLKVEVDEMFSKAENETLREDKLREDLKDLED